MLHSDVVMSTDFNIHNVTVTKIESEPAELQIPHV